MALANRYKQLLSIIPKGSFYNADGQILPFKGDASYTFTLSTAHINTQFAIYINNVLNGFTTSDTNGVATVTCKLIKGRNDIRIEAANSTDKISTCITTRDSATVLAGVAEVIERMDSDLEQVLRNCHIQEAELDALSTIYGRLINLTSLGNYSIEAYRDAIKEFIIAYRHYGGTVEGLNRIVAAITNVHPLLFSREFGKVWILGNDFIRDSYNTAKITAYTTSSLSTINAGGAVISITDFSSNLNRNQVTPRVGFIAKSGTGTGSIDITGTPSADQYIQIQCVAAGTATTATANIYVNGGSATLITCNTTPTAITGTGLSVAFIDGAAGTSFKHNDIYKIQAYNNSTIQNNCTINMTNGVPSYATMQIVGEFQGNSVAISTDNTEYTLYAAPRFNPIYSTRSPYTISTANSMLYLNINNRGIIPITFATGSQTSTYIASTINTALVADQRYGGQFSMCAQVCSIGGGYSVFALVPPNPDNGTVEILMHLEPNIVTGWGYNACQTLFDIPYLRAELVGSLPGGGLFNVLTTTHDLSNWPDPTVENPLDIIIGRGAYCAAGSAATAVNNINESAKVISIDKVAKILTLASPILYDKADGSLIEIANQMPFMKASGSDRYIKIKAAHVSNIVTASSTIAVVSTGVPDNTLATTGSGATTISPSHTYFDQTYDKSFSLLTSGSTNTSFICKLDKSILNYAGFKVNVKVFWSIDDFQVSGLTQNSISSISTSFDGSTYTAQSIVTNNTQNAALGSPALTTASFYVPTVASGIWLKISPTASTNGNILIHKIKVLVDPVHSSLYLGSGTIPRDQTRSKRGMFAYVWCPDQLTTNENAILGLDHISSNGIGHIDNILPASAYNDRYNVTNFSGGVPLNIYGAYDDVGLQSPANKSNLSLILRSPARLSFMRPTAASATSQNLTFVASNATLAVESTGDKATSILYEDGVPVTQDQWSYTSSTIVNVTFTPAPELTYTLEYQARTYFETSIIDLTTSYADYLWYVDYNIPIRPDTQVRLANTSTNVSFDTSGVATIKIPAVVDKTQASLVQYLPTSTTTIPQLQWNFVDNYTIAVNGQVIDPNAVYVFNYVSENGYIVPSASASVKVRSSNDMMALSGLTYTEVKYNTPVAQQVRYHQFIVELYNINNVADVSFKSVLLKGIGLYNPLLTAPLLK